MNILDRDHRLAVASGPLILGLECSESGAAWKISLDPYLAALRARYPSPAPSQGATAEEEALTALTGSTVSA